MKNFYKNLLKLNLLLIFVSISSGYALIFIDFQPFHFSHLKDGRKGIRVVQFDVEAQKFDKIEYFIFSDLIIRTPNLHPLLGIKFDSKANLRVASTLDLKKYAIRTTGSIQVDFPKPIIPNHFYIKKAIVDSNEYETLMLKPFIPLNADVLRENLSKFKKKKTMGNFQADFITLSPLKSKKVTLLNLSNVTVENNKERAKLGELATDLTLYAYGYEKWPSKYQHDHGLDGVYTYVSHQPSSKRTFPLNSPLLLTESKCRQESTSARFYMENELSEKKIRLKIQKMQQDKDLSVQETANLILYFINHAPHKIYKFVHRIKPDATAQILIEDFSLEDYKTYEQKDKNKVLTFTSSKPSSKKLVQNPSLPKRPLINQNLLKKLIGA